MATKRGRVMSKKLFTVGCKEYQNIEYNDFCNCPFYNPNEMPSPDSKDVIYCKTCGKAILIERVKKSSFFF